MSDIARRSEALIRPFRRNPGFALAVLVILALGIGANTATLNLLYGYLLAPLPYPHAGRLVNVYFTSEQTPGNQGMSYPTYFDLRAQTTAMAQAGMYQPESLNLVEGARAVHADGAAVSASLFTTLGVRPLLGRVFGPASNQPGAARSVVLSYRLWSRLFDRNPAVLGRTVTLNDTAYTVIGVMPAAFQFPDSATDLWLPKGISAFDHDPGNLTAWNDTMIARLAPGMSVAQLATQSHAVLQREVAHFPDPKAIPLFNKLGMRIIVTPLRSALLGGLNQELILAQLATGILLLLVWFNLANLFITRALTRRGELTVRRVLGAETRVLFRQLLAESLAPCLLGGIAGLLLGEAFVRVLLASGFGNTALAFPLRDWGIAAGIALLLALLSALVFSLAGLHFIRRQDLGQALRDADARSAGGRGEHRVRAGLAITQIALAAALIGAGALLARSLAKLDAVRLGFQPQHVLTFQVQIPPHADGTMPPDLVTRLAALHRALAQVPGVTAATVDSDVPFDGQQTPGAAYPYPFDGRHTPSLYRLVADPGYFETFDIPLLAGRAFAPRDTASQAPSAVVDVQAARELFGTTEVVGRELSINDPNDTKPGLLFRIVGIVAHTRQAHLSGGGDAGAVYLDLPQTVDPNRSGSGWSWAFPTWYVAVRTPLDPAAILPALRRAVSQTLPDVPVYDVRSMNARLAGEIAPRRGLAALVLMFALGALAVAAVGLYAVQSYAVSQRRPELGIRAALGADGKGLRALVLREVLVLLAIGLTVGLCAVVALGRVLSAVLYDVHAADPASLVLVVVVLSVTAVLAGWIPALRASRVPPMEALRDR
ncbi:MAG: ADOP family duplicated permease [Steroidobacteraceae bacterium]